MKEDITRARIENIWLERPVWVLAITLVVIVLAAREIYKGKVKFDYNLMQMQSPTLRPLFMSNCFSILQDSPCCPAVIRGHQSG